MWWSRTGMPPVCSLGVAQRDVDQRGHRAVRRSRGSVWEVIFRQEHVAPYMAVGLSTVVHGIGSRRDIERNLQIVEDGIHAAVSIIGINMPVRLIALFFFNDTASTEIYTLSLHDALPMQLRFHADRPTARGDAECRYGERLRPIQRRSEEHTSELQSRVDLVCSLLLE